MPKTNTVSRFRIIILIATYFVAALSNASAQNTLDNLNIAEKMKQWCRLREECRVEIFNRIEMAIRDDSIDISALSKDIQTANACGLFEKSDIHKLIAVIDFPSSAKKPPVVTEIIRGGATPDPYQTPIARVLSDLGADAAEGCLEVLSSKKSVSVSERQMWSVVRKIYPKDALSKLERKLGDKNSVFIQLKNEMETGPPKIILYE